MKRARTLYGGVILSGLILAACQQSATPQAAPESAEPQAAALPSAATAFQVDPYWPKELPEDWLLGNVVGTAIDSHDNVWITHRPNSHPAAAKTPPCDRVQSGRDRDPVLGRREDLVRYARQNGAPNDISIGRGMKVSSEEYLGMLVALETSLGISEEADFAYKRERFSNIIEQIEDLPGVTSRVFVSESETDELYLDIDWDTDLIKLDRQQFIDALRDETLPILRTNESASVTLSSK